MIDLSDKVMLVTGGARGIGKAIVEMAAAAGATVAINYIRSAAAAEALRDELNRAGKRAACFRADVSNREEVVAMVAAVVEQLGKLDILVNNAGIWQRGPIEEMTPAAWEQTISTNLTSAYHCCHAVVPHMIRRRRGGRIINIASTAGQRGEAYYSHYAASKGGIISLTKSLAVELAPHDILVNCVAPGWVATDMTAQAIAEEGEEITKLVPLRRPGRPEEIAGPVVFLASSLADYMTGEIMNVNGGNVLCG